MLRGVADRQSRAVRPADQDHRHGHAGGLDDEANIARSRLQGVVGRGAGLAPAAGVEPDHAVLAGQASDWEVAWLRRRGSFGAAADVATLPGSLLERGGRLGV